MDRTAELAAWMRLLAAPGVGRLRARKLLQQWGSLAAAAAAQAQSRETSTLIERSQHWLQADARRSLLCLGDPDYPERLLHSPDPPLLLFLEGQREPLSAMPAMAVVGSRHPTPQGRDNARLLARQLAQAGYAVVSGLAMGIDGEAHWGALSGAMSGATTGGVSWAVLGSGLDVVHPRSHQALAERLREQGLLISEHAPGTPPLPPHFPARNRIIAGLSIGCLVVEAAEKSGSLITARLALEAGREVFAVPGSIHAPQSRGCHQLIREGATLVTCIEDMLPELAPLPAPAAAPLAEADPVLAAMGWQPCSLDALLARLGWRTEDLLARLLDLELEGQVRRVPGGLFERRACA